jgi:hypothetical protein
MLPIQSGTIADLSGRLAHIKKKSELAGQVWQPTSDYNGCLERLKLKKASNDY